MDHESKIDDGDIGEAAVCIGAEDHVSEKDSEFDETDDTVCVSAEGQHITEEDHGMSTSRYNLRAGNSHPQVSVPT